jgi:hypothetical protein
VVPFPRRTGEEGDFGPGRLDPEKRSPKILGDSGCINAGLVHPRRLQRRMIAELKNEFEHE